MQSLNHAASTQCHINCTHAHAQEMKLFPWFCKNPSIIHLPKQIALAKWQTDKET